MEDKKDFNKENEEKELCPKCGTLMEEDENGELYCPECSYEIDFFGEAEEGKDW